MNIDFNNTLKSTQNEQIELYEKTIKSYENFSKKKGCETCLHCKHIIDYPHYVTSEECICLVGLECDTVLYSINNCPKYKKNNNVIQELKEIIQKLQV